MRSFAICTMVLATVLAASGDIEASQRPALYQAANEYRDAVREFERQVLRLHYIERCDERLVDDLEDQTSILRSAARHPEISNRFAEAWFKTQTLQSQVEAAIFGRSCYPRHPALERCWQAVIYQYAVMVAQIECLQLHPRGTHPVFYPSSLIPIPTTVNVRSSLPIGTFGSSLIDGPQAMVPDSLNGSVATPLPAPTMTPSPASAGVKSSRRSL